MELKEAILGRRSIRQYKNTAVADEVLQEILDLAMWAPSGVNLQPWYFVVLRSTQETTKVRALMAAAAEKMRPVLQQRFVNFPQVAKETESFISSVGGAPVIVLVFLNKNYEGNEQDFAMQQSAAAAVQNLCLAAHDKGLGSCWMTAAHTIEEQLVQAYGQGKGKYIAMVALGYAAQEGNAPKRKDGRCEFL